jgi:hypothetical protein
MSMLHQERHDRQVELQNGYPTPVEMAHSLGMALAVILYMVCVILLLVTVLVH